jgi:drug/metabolite transporter (DMT)-like permease
LCSYAFADVLFFSAARRIGISTALSIASIYPLWAAAYGALVRHEAFGLGRAAGTLLCIVGVIALVRLSHRKTEKADFIGVAMCVVTSIMWAGNTITIKIGSEGLSISQVNMIRFAIAIVLLAIPVLARPQPPHPPVLKVWRRLVPAIFLDAIVGSIAYVYGLSHTDLAVGATLSSLSPLISVPIAIWMGEEQWSAARFVAVTATVAGVVVLISAG